MAEKEMCAQIKQFAFASFRAT